MFALHLQSRVHALARLFRDPQARELHAWFRALEENDALRIELLRDRDPRLETQALRFALEQQRHAPEEVRRARGSYYRWLREQSLVRAT